MYTYLLLNLFTISIPLAYSFERKIGYFRKWKYLFAAIFLTGLFFLAWDSFFTSLEIWSFNKDYLTGIHIFNLPVEEWLFFITVPFACVFIYESIKYYMKRDYLKPYVKTVTFALIGGFTAIALLNTDRLYTTVNFSLAALFLFLHYYFFKDKYLGRFYFAYLVHLIPFFIVNGILTYLPVVIYNNDENLNIRLGTIPVEDTVYSMLLLLINITLYEFLYHRKRVKSIK